MRCDFCLFESDSKAAFRAHYRLAACRSVRSILFCCKMCDYVGHSIKDIRLHLCSRVRFEFNEMERLRSEATKKGQRLITTVAETEWYKMDDELKQVRTLMNRPTLSLKEISMNSREQLLHVPSHVLFSLTTYKTWLNETGTGLPPLSLESISKVNKNRYSDRFFVFSVLDECDVRHFFKLLFAKAEAAYWPFCVDNSTISNWIFNSKWGLFFRNQNGTYVKETHDQLSNALFELRYTHWGWSCMSDGDFFRMICQEWTTLHYKNIINVLSSVPGIVNPLFTDLEKESERVQEKIGKLFPYLFDFVKFWDDIHSVLERVERNDLVPVFELKECVELSMTFEEAVHRFISKKKALGWQPILRALRSHN